MVSFYSASNVEYKHFNLENIVIAPPWDLLRLLTTCLQNMLLKQFSIRTFKYHNYCLWVFLRNLDVWVQTVSQLTKICLRCVKGTNLHVQMSLLGKQTGTTVHCGGCLNKTSSQAEIIRSRGRN